MSETEPVVEAVFIGPALPPPLPRWRTVPFPRAVLPACLVAGVLGAELLPLDRPAIGWFLVAVVMAAVVFLADRQAWDRVMDLSPARVVWTLTAFALLSVGAFRASVWLFVLCVLAAFVAGSLAVVGPRSIHGLCYDVFAVPIEALRGLPWLSHGAKSGLRHRGDRSKKLTVSALVTVGLLGIFVPLLSAADADFAALLGKLAPSRGLDAGPVVRWLFLAGSVGLLVMGALYLLASPPARRNAAVTPRRTLSASEWGLPVAALTGLFGVFVAVQVATLFGGDGYVLGTAGVTYAEYARHGFWQLSAITVLTLGVIVIVLRFGSQESAAARRWLRIALGALTALTLLIIASALSRMWIYQQAYGFTVLRLLVEACEVWLGVVYLMVVAALVRLKATWLPRAAIGTAIASLLALAVLNPERFIAQRNIDQFLDHGIVLDVNYLQGLSTDIVPAVQGLPEPTRSCLLTVVEPSTDQDGWTEWNLSRASARDVRPVIGCCACG